MMKKIALLPLALWCLGGSLLADDQIRNAQSELKSLGFFYGDVDGQPGAETTAAIRRYQIRNGLEVTGSLNQETVAAIGLSPTKSPAPQSPQPVAKATPPAPAPVLTPSPAPVVNQAPPVNLRRETSVEESDRNFLRREESRAANDPSVIAPPEPLEAPSPDFPVLFAHTPYADAPLEVQERTLRRAQAILSSRGFYRDIVDGLPGPATEEALLSYQRASRLTLTGRLDLDTLSQLRLLPNSANYSDAAPRRAYRGIWINRGDLHFGVEFN